MLSKSTKSSFNINAIPIVAGSMLLFGGYLLLGGSVAFSDNALAETANSEITASIDSIISITAPTTASMTITPNYSSSTFSTATASVSVTTNSAYGYSLTMGTSGTTSSGTATTALLNSANESLTLPSITADSTQSTFADNSWGFTTDNNGSDTATGQITSGTYKALTTTSSPTLIKSTTTTANADTTTVTFGAKVASSQPSGNYTNTVVFSATANPPIITLFDIDDMQEVEADVCEATTTPSSSATLYDEDGSHKGDSDYIPSVTLTDTRDNKSYAVRKLADGNCWMVQNLALDVGTALSSDDTDIESTSTYTMPTTSTTNFTVGSNPKYSGDNNNEMHIGTHTDGHVASVDDGSLYSSDLTDTGNWYSWYVATAGTGTNTMSSGEATSSICSKGWKLPTGTTSCQFYALYTAYSSTQANLNAVFPLQLSGYYYSSGLRNSGSYGTWWSSTATSTSNAYSMLALTSTINPGTNYNNKYYGFSVRCVAASS